MSETLKVNEIFYSIQGESTHAGRPCVFVRLTHCNLRCTYCDTEYAFYEGQDKSFNEILDEIKSYKCNLVEITGGEPLVQKDVIQFMDLLCEQGYEVLLETGGHMDISPVDQRVQRIMDIKCPSSGESEKNLWSNITLLTEKDQLKFVIGSREDYDWAKSIIYTHKLTDVCTVLMSTVHGNIDNRDLAEWILNDNLQVRYQLQLHKYIWPSDARGV